MYALDGEWATFIADVGPDSDSRSDAVMDFEVYLDDKKVDETWRATVTKSEHIELSVIGVVQLRLVAKHVSGSTSGAFTGQAAWGAARVERE
ncbi:NPCBM/NEW2 domain-containing protein [Streptomyces sp. NPDC006997]|uniref:NPCBM/NEW2 domain-containing protein n=1 Tax=Streptomyces sp. NPDC006997 TaxID=3155356 RepID=UPI0033F3D7A2